MANELKIEISEAQIQNAIAVALVEQFSPERQQQLLLDIVRAHLTVKKDNYSRETLLGAQVGGEIRKMASEHMATVIETWRPQVYKIVEKSMGRKFQENVFAQLEASLKNKMISGISIQVTGLDTYEDDD